MNITGLRIGNFVSLKLFGEFETFEDICVERQIKASEFFRAYHHPEEVEPIKLTEKWLMNFGIDPSHKIGISRRFYALGYNLHFEICPESIGVYFKGELMCFITYVHQLQNLYFSLLNEELEYKKIL